MISKSKADSQFDIILITGEAYDDHPLSPAGIIARVLDARGYSVGIIEKPEKKEDFTRLGSPKLFFAVTSGSIDSMLNNYTPLKKRRHEDVHSKTSLMPDRAVIVYCNRIREYFRGAKIVIGGIEASLRRFAHYDYWDNKVRRSILLDSRADILVYGNGEKQIIEIAERIKRGATLKGILGTCILSKEIPPGFTELPSFNEVLDSKERFCEMQVKFSNYRNLCQKYENSHVLQYKFPEYTTEDLDWIYSLPYSRKLSPNSLLNLAQFSVVTHRGCIGNCNFCSIALHQGTKIISRSEESILSEIKRITKHSDFKGYIDDLGGPSANMYGLDFESKSGDSSSDRIESSHKRIIRLLRKARQIPGVKKIFVRSGIRYDLAIRSRDYIKEISEHHISGSLKIAPEHFSEKVLKLMNKNVLGFSEFYEYFNSLNRGKGQSLRYYLMIGHPGEDEATMKELVLNAKKLKNIEQFQLFTPTPMSVSTCMYWTGLDPYTKKPVHVVRDYATKKRFKRMMLECVSSSERKMHQE
jgi:uncharacterized radical SAM protein YgiQ